MPEQEGVISTCETCGGAEGELCPECLGTGSLPLKGQILVFKSIIDAAAALNIKATAIIDEQASQRAALKAKLGDIWDKVKNL